MDDHRDAAHVRQTVHDKDNSIKVIFQLRQTKQLYMYFSLSLW
jgi:hypothetical protein